MDNNKYDEDLSRNDFFRAIQTFEKGEWFQNGVGKGWIFCIPKSSSLPKRSKDDTKGTKETIKGPKYHDQFDINILMQHILIPSEESPDTYFVTLEGRDVRITGNIVTLANKGMKIDILF